MTISQQIPKRRTSNLHFQCFYAYSSISRHFIGQNPVGTPFPIFPKKRARSVRDVRDERPYFHPIDISRITHVSRLSLYTLIIMLSCLRLFIGILVVLCQVKALRIANFKKMLIPSVASVIVGFGNYMPADAATPAEIKCTVTIRQGDLLPAGDKVALYLTGR